MRTCAQQIFILVFSVSSVTWAPCWVRRDPTQELSPAGEADGAHAAGCVGVGSSGGHPALGRTAPWAVHLPGGRHKPSGLGRGRKVNKMKGTPTGAKARGSGGHRDSEKAKTEQKGGRVESGEWGRPWRDEFNPRTRPG